MLRLPFDIIKHKEPVYPVRFEKHNICVHCGSTGTLVFVNKWGKETKKEIYPFNKIKCTKCGTVYSIMWQMDDNGDMYPTAVDESFRLEFINCLLATQKVNQ